jgi:hypothetical protein
MKNLLLILIISLTSCVYDEPECKYTNYGILTSVRIDDDAEYHFSTDYNAVHDVPTFEVIIERKNADEPYLYIRQCRCPENKSCDMFTNKWDEDMHSYNKYKLLLPLNYKIDTFND